MCTLWMDFVLGGYSQESAKPRIGQSGGSDVVIGLHDERAAGHSELSSAPVNMGVVFHEPHVAKDDNRLADTSDMEGGSL